MYAPWPVPSSYAFVDVDTGCAPGSMTDPAELVRIAPGLQAQLREDIAPEWSPMSLADVVRANLDAPPKPGERRIELHLNAPDDEQGALALHDKDEHGIPIIRVFVNLLIQCGATLSPAVSHELAEATADPEGDVEATLPDGRIVAVEIADQVEAITYVKNGVEVSNFNTKKNFGISGGADRYDFLGKQPGMFVTMPGGYSQVLTSDGWQMITADRAPLTPLGVYKAELERRGLSRPAKRRRKHAALLQRIEAMLDDIGRPAGKYEVSAVLAFLREQRSARAA